MQTACCKKPLGALAVVLLMFAFAADAAPCEPTSGHVKLYCRTTSPYFPFCINQLANAIANAILDLNSRSATNGKMKLCFGRDPPDAATGVILETDDAWNSDALFADLNLYMLIRMNYLDYPPDFTAGQRDILTNALESGALKRLMIYDSRAALDNQEANYPGINISLCSGGQPEVYPIDDIVGLQSAFTTADPNHTESGFPVTTLGPAYGSVQGATFSGFFAASGHCVLDAVTAVTACNPVVYFEAYNGDVVLPVGFTYCLGSGVVFYSTQPMDFYGVNGWLQYSKLFEATLSTLLGPAPVLREPVCPVNVFVSRAWLPSNGKMTQVDITSVSYPNGTVPAEDTITITAMDSADTTQGAHPTYPLADYTTEAQNPATVTLRAERNGNGPGRVYRIKYTATTQQSSMPPKSCDGQAYVCIPHDASVADAASITMTSSARENKLCPDPQSITTWMPAIAYGGPAVARRFGTP